MPWALIIATDNSETPNLHPPKLAKFCLLSVLQGSTREKAPKFTISALPEENAHFLCEIGGGGGVGIRIWWLHRFLLWMQSMLSVDG